MDCEGRHVITQQTNSGEVKVQEGETAESLIQVRRAHVQRVLGITLGDRDAAARILGLSRPQLERLLKSLKLGPVVGPR